MKETAFDQHSEKLFRRPVPYAQHLLIRPMCFYIENSKENTVIGQLIKDNGGLLSANPGEVGSNIINLAERKPAVPAKTPFYSVNYVKECIKSNSLLDRENFLLGSMSDRLRPRVRSSIANTSHADDNGFKRMRATRKNTVSKKRSRHPSPPKNGNISVSEEDGANHRPENDIQFEGEVHNPNNAIPPTTPAISEEEIRPQHHPVIDEPEIEVVKTNQSREDTWVSDEDEDILWIVERAQQLAIEKNVSKPKIFSLRYWKAFQKKNVLPKGRSPSECLERFKHLFHRGNLNADDYLHKVGQPFSENFTDNEQSNQDAAQHLPSKNSVHEQHGFHEQETWEKQNSPGIITRSRRASRVETPGESASPEKPWENKGPHSGKASSSKTAYFEKLSVTKRSSPRDTRRASSVIPFEQNAVQEIHPKQNLNSRKRRISGQEKSGERKRVRVEENEDMVAPAHPNSDIEVIKVTHRVDEQELPVEGNTSLEAMRESVIKYVKNLAKKANVSERSAFCALRDNDGRWCKALNALRSSRAQ